MDSDPLDWYWRPQKDFQVSLHQEIWTMWMYQHPCQLCTWKLHLPKLVEWLLRYIYNNQTKTGRQEILSWQISLMITKEKVYTLRVHTTLPTRHSSLLMLAIMESDLATVENLICDMTLKANHQRKWWHLLGNLPCIAFTKLPMITMTWMTTCTTISLKMGPNSLAESETIGRRSRDLRSCSRSSMIKWSESVLFTDTCVADQRLSAKLTIEKHLQESASQWRQMWSWHHLNAAVGEYKELLWKSHKLKLLDIGTTSAKLWVQKLHTGLKESSRFVFCFL